MMNEGWTYEKFQKLLAEGQDAERLVMYLLEREYPKKAAAIPNEDPATMKYWDFEFDGKKYEVKTALRAHDYGSIFVEWKQSGEWSGLKITAANVYVYVLPDKAMFVDVWELRSFIKARAGTSGVKLVKDAGFDGEAEGAVLDLDFFNPLTLITYKQIPIPDFKKP